MNKIISFLRFAFFVLAIGALVYFIWFVPKADASWNGKAIFRFPDASISEQSNVSDKWFPSKWTKKKSVLSLRGSWFSNRGIGEEKRMGFYKR